MEPAQALPKRNPDRISPVSPDPCHEDLSSRTTVLVFRILMVDCKSGPIYRLLTNPTRT